MESWKFLSLSSFPLHTDSIRLNWRNNYKRVYSNLPAFKKLPLQSIILVLIFFSCFFCSKEVPNHEFYPSPISQLDGGAVDLSSYLGKKIVVLDFWATWCEPCKKAVPTINRWQNSVSSEHFVFFGVNTDTTESLDSIREHSKSLRMLYPTLLDKDWKVTEHYKVDGIPCLIVFDATGQIVYRQYGLVASDLPGLLARSGVWMGGVSP
ncbi:TlpA disulfide reductase family protein [Leptospira sp. 96542]|nr:TlpA disulfide reductase family protein [Leptospira sp. 96542]